MAEISGEKKSSDTSFSVRQKIENGHNILGSELQKLEEKKNLFLALPAKRERIFMNKIKWLAMVLLFASMGFLFFLGGFITCYTVFPPRPRTMTLTGIPEGGDKALTAGRDTIVGENSYATRRSVLNGISGGDANTLLEVAEGRSIKESQQMTRAIIGHVLDGWSQKIREALGPIIGAAVVPMTTGLARSATDKILSADPLAKSLNNNQQEKEALNSPPIDKPSENSAHAPTSTQGNPDSRGLYTIAIQDFLSSSDALSMENDLKARGFGAYTTRTLTPDGHVSFSVRAGTFKTFQEARDAASVLSELWGRPARVMILENETGQQMTQKAR